MTERSVGRERRSPGGVGRDGRQRRRTPPCTPAPDTDILDGARLAPTVPVAMTDPLPPPYGGPSGPELPREQLLGHYLGGGASGWSEHLRIEEALLVGAGYVPLAIRLGEGAVLVREDLPDDEAVASLRDALLAALGDAGIGLVDEDATLGGVVGIEVAGVRGGIWSLWARDPEEGQSVLERRALGEVADFVDTDQLRRQQEIDATLADMERDLERLDGVDEPGDEPGEEES